MFSAGENFSAIFNNPFRYRNSTWAGSIFSELSWTFGFSRPRSAWLNFASSDDWDYQWHIGLRIAYAGHDLDMV
jgi:hypothetical protein